MGIPSAYSRPKKITSTSKLVMDETYDLRGLNMAMPDQVIPKGESPHTINSRMYAKDSTDNRVAIRKRLGCEFLSTPIGETGNITNENANTGDTAVSTTTIIAQPFTANADGLLTKLELEIKTNGSVSGPVLVTIHPDYNGRPSSELLGSSSLKLSTITSSYQFLPAYFIDAPELTNTETYWMKVVMQSNGNGSYHLGHSADTGALSTTNSISYTDLGVSLRYKTYTSTAGEILGYTRQYLSDGTKRTIVAFNQDIYTITDEGVATSIYSLVNASATYVRFDQVDDKLIWVDGFSNAKWWDGTTVSDVPGAPSAPTNVLVHKNRAFFTNSKTRYDFSDLYNFESYPSVNFFYVPNPKSPDPVTGHCMFQDNLVIFTHETKHTLFGSDISSFTRREAVGSKGAVSQEAIAVAEDAVYFMSDDKMIRRWNGVSDQIISEKVRPELSAISDTSKVRLEIHDNQLYVYYIKNAGSSVQDVLICELGSFIKEKELQWFHDTGRFVFGGLTWYLDGDQYVEFSSRTGQMFTANTGYSDAGKPITFRYWTQYLTYGSGASKVKVKRFRPVIRPSQAAYTLYVGKDVDFQNDGRQNSALMSEVEVDAGGARWAEFSWNDGTTYDPGSTYSAERVALSGRGNHTQYRFEESGVGTDVQLYGYISQLKVGKPK